MAINFVPHCGTILICKFDGLLEPEMTKRRPVVVVSPKSKERRGLCTVVPLSTTDPRPVKSHHYKLKTAPPLPEPYNSDWHWVKADMLYTMSYQRLSMPLIGKDESGNRIYDDRVVSEEDLDAIRKCILNGLGISFACG